MKRRQFILSLAGSAAAVGWAGWKLGSARPQDPAGNLARFTRRSWALGANVNLTVYHHDRKEAETALEAAFAELNQVEDVLSLYRPDSQLARLNRNSRLDNAHPYLLKVLERSARLSLETDGAFDVTVQPLYTLYAENARQGKQPDGKDLEMTLAKVGWRRVKINGASVVLEEPGTEITLNGIAQGFAADAVGQVLMAHGIQHALIDTGEIGTVGAHAEKASWDIGIRHPREADGYLALAELNGRSMATSGDYETRFGEGYDHHHLLDPRTGSSPTELSSVSVAAPSAMEADALSTALFLVGLRKGMAMIESMPDADALFVTKSGQMSKSSGFPINS